MDTNRRTEDNCTEKTGEVETSTAVFGEIEEMIDEVEAKFNRFKNFDVIDRPPHDHRYYKMSSLRRTKVKGSGSSFSRRIKQELRVLEKNIPSWVFVRTYSQRIDLMRAAIIGPPNTPYHHCLFFFDIKFPGNYPSKPPKFHYRSFGIDLNPKLRLDGKIGLQALSETKYDCVKQCWSGDSSNKETWDPEESNVLHVFHVIRMTILSKLEPLEKHNERIFTLTCQKMIKILKEPPADFQDFVAGYFRKRAHWVLQKFGENKYNDSHLMIDLFVRMFKAFERNGAYCKHHICFLRSIERRNCGVDVEAKIRELEG